MGGWILVFCAGLFCFPLSVTGRFFDLLGEAAGAGLEAERFSTIGSVEVGCVLEGGEEGLSLIDDSLSAICGSSRQLF